jgi:type IV pilus assembly protein PilP
MKPRSFAGVLVAAMLLLQGCDPGQADLQAWMDQTRRNTPSRIDQLEEPKRFEPFRFRPEVGSDPFAPTRVNARASAAASGVGSLAANAAGAAKGGAGLRPNDRREREPLEAFPLDQFRMVGSLRRGSEHIGLLRGEKQLHQIRMGQYIGQNHGRVIRIADDQILIREIVQDAAGDWISRDTEMRLQESAP